MVSRLERYWYAPTPVVVPLLPLAGLYCVAVLVRRALYRHGLRRVHHAAVPVIVVGNLTIGGTGKTPLVIWLAQFLKERGYRPGIVSRGYRGRARHWPQQVRSDSDPAMVGDEPVLIARHCACPLAVGPDRVRAVTELLAHHPCDVVISDDGLQHYRLGRSVEIVVIDGVRRYGNGFCLPAGPLREPLGRLRSVDLLVVSGLAGRGEHALRLEGRQAWRVDEPSRRVGLDTLRGGGAVHAVAGIGHPERFFDALRRAGLEVVPHPFPDHHRFRREDLEFGDARPVLMTEKDAVKCERFAAEHWWYVPLQAMPDERFGEAVLERLRVRAGAEEAAADHVRHTRGA